MIEHNKDEYLQIIKETGISGDYINEISGVVADHSMVYVINDMPPERIDEMMKEAPRKYAKINMSGTELISQSIKKKPIRKYEERFPEKKYPDLFNDQTRERVQKINSVAGKLNQMTDPESFTELEFKILINEMMCTVYGDEERNYYHLDDNVEE